MHAPVLLACLLSFSALRACCSGIGSPKRDKLTNVLLDTSISLDVLASDGPWRTRPPISDTMAASVQSGASDEFRGTFRDLSLWVKRGEWSEDVMGVLWVVEVDDAELMEKERKQLKKLGLEVMLQEKLSLVVRGKNPEALGYDACKSGSHRTIIEVANHEVTIRTMPSDSNRKYMDMAQIKNPLISSLASLVSESGLKQRLTHLQNYNTRNTFSGKQGLEPAANWAAEILADYGFEVSRHKWKQTATATVTATFAGTETPDRIIVIGAHLDSVSYGSQGNAGARGCRAFGGSRDCTQGPAPGADDNGSGSVAILEIARTIKESGLRFQNTIMLVLFTGEENNGGGGLMADSKWLARKMKSERQNVVAMLNADMLGYKAPGESITPTLFGRNTDSALNSIVTQIIKIYFPSMKVGSTTGCCSDSQQFHENGFPATTITEAPVKKNPKIHTPDDKTDRLDFNQIRQLTAVVVTSCAVFAEPVLAPTPAPPPELRRRRGQRRRRRRRKGSRRRSSRRRKGSRRRQ